MGKNRNTCVAWVFFAATALFAGAAQAASPPRPRAASGDALFAVRPVSDARLMRIRGGFDLGNGLLASFGISRFVYINGNLKAQTTINIPDLSHMSRAQINALGSALGRVNVIRNGDGNHVIPGSVGQALGAMVIQNSLNNQQIRTVTVIDAKVKALNAFHGINIGDTLQSALINARTH